MKVRGAFRRERKKSIYRKLSDRIKPTSKGAFLQCGTIKTPVYEDGELVSWVVQDLSEERSVKRKRRKRKAKKARVLRRRNTATNHHAWGDRTGISKK